MPKEIIYEQEIVIEASGQGVQSVLPYLADAMFSMPLLPALPGFELPSAEMLAALPKPTNLLLTQASQQKAQTPFQRSVNGN